MQSPGASEYDAVPQNAGDARPGDGPAAPLEHVVDDDTPRREAIHWAADELFADRTFDQVTASLVEGGWSEDVAQEIVEAARQQTRDQRGVLTRDRIVGSADAYYRRATGRWFVGMPVLAAAWRLLHSLATLAALRRATRGDREGVRRGVGATSSTPVSLSQQDDG